MNILGRNSDLGILILRVSVGGLMLLHGVFKIIHGPGAIEGILKAAGHAPIFAYGVYVGEVLAPLLIILGYGTRAAALVLAINCLVAACLTNQITLNLNAQGGLAGELLALFFFGALALLCTGGGKYALSRRYSWD